MRNVKITYADMAEAVAEFAHREGEIVRGFELGTWCPPRATERRHMEWRAAALEAAVEELVAMARLMATNGKGRKVG